MIGKVTKVCDVTFACASVIAQALMLETKLNEQIFFNWTTEHEQTFAKEQEGRNKI